MRDPVEVLRRALGARYEIEREIGSGGAATVYLARDLRHDRLVALKVLRADSTTSAVDEARFAREIKPLARRFTNRSLFLGLRPSDATTRAAVRLTN